MRPHGHTVVQLFGGCQAVVRLGLGTCAGRDARDGLLQAVKRTIPGHQTGRARRAVIVVQLLAKQFGEIHVLARILVGVVPVFRAQVEVARGAELDRLGADLAGDVDAAFQVGQEQVAVGVGNLAAHIQVLRCVGYGDAQVVERPVVRVLHDADLAVATGTGHAQGHAVEISGARVEAGQGLANHFLAAAVKNGDIADHQAKRRAVGEVDQCCRMGQQAAIRHGRRQRPGLCVGLDEDATARGGDSWHLQEQLVKLGARRHRAAGFLCETHLEQLPVNGFHQGLVARNRLGIAGVAFHPAHDLGPVLKQLVGHIGVDQFGQRHALGLDDVKIIAQVHGELEALVALDRCDLRPACAIEVGSGAHTRLRAGALGPLAGLRAHGLAGVDGEGSGAGFDLHVGRHQFPALGVAVIFVFQHQAFVQVTAGRKLVELAGLALAHREFARHQFHHGASGHTDGHVFHVQWRVLVLLRGVESECCFFQVGQRLAQPVGRKLALTVHPDRQDLDFGLVVHARFHRGGAAQRHGVVADSVGRPAGTHAVGNGREVHHQAVHPRPVAANALFGHQVHVAHGAHAGAALQINQVVFDQLARHQGNADARERHGGHVSTGHGAHPVGHAVISLTGEQADVRARQLGVDQHDGVVGVQTGERVGVGTRHSRHSQTVGVGHQRGHGLRGNFQIAGEVAQLGPTNHDVGLELGILQRRGRVQRDPAQGIDPDFIDGIDIGDGGDSEHATPRRRGFGDQLAAIGNMDLRAKAVVGCPQIGCRAKHAERAQTATKRLQRIVKT